ncbi:MAG: metal-dependent transcriptional regulator [Actinomycetota bacterium]
MRATASPAAQDYLKGIYLTQWETPRAGSRGVATTVIAHRLGVSAASATNMLKRLDDMGLVSYVPYKGAALTDAGRKIALEVVRHHRLLETYLAEALGVPWDEVHDEAEVLEHVLSEDLEERIASLLGHPTSDPHGHPIPSKDGAMPESSQRRLWDVSAGERIAIDRVSDAEAEGLRYLAGVGIRPGVTVEVVRRGPIGGPLFVKVIEEDDEVQALSRELAEAVWVA